MAHFRKTIGIPGYVGNAISAVDCTQLDLGYETRFGTLNPTILHIQGVHGPAFFSHEAHNKKQCSKSIMTPLLGTRLCLQFFCCQGSKKLVKDVLIWYSKSHFFLMPLHILAHRDFEVKVNNFRFIMLAIYFLKSLIVLDEGRSGLVSRQTYGT